MKIEVCMGSSCHAKGASRVLDLLREAIATNKLEDKIELAGSICLGACKENGANLRVDGEVVSGITKENFYEFFNTKVIDALK